MRCSILFSDCGTYLNVNIADKMIAQIVAHIHLFDLAIFVFTFDEHIFKEIVVMLLHFLV